MTSSLPEPAPFSTRNPGVFARGCRAFGRLSLVVAMVMAAGSALGQLPEPVQTYFLALPEADVRSDFQALQPNRTVGNVMRVVTSVTITRDSTIIYYDQWEDGYENNLSSPKKLLRGSRPAGTQIWGDNDPSNGIPPGFATDLLMAGDILALKNDVQLPRNSNTVYFDGRDKLAASKAVAVTRAQWAINPGPVLAGAVELATIEDTGTEYLIPIGEDMNSNRMFEHVSLSVMSMVNGNRVQVDRDGDGSFDVTKNLNEGETLFVSSGIEVGARVSSNKPVQAQIMTGNISTRGGNLEGRWYSMKPRADWGSDYYCPVGSVDSPDQPTRLFIYNPNGSPITVAYEGLADTGTFSIPSGEVEEFVMPVNSAVNLTSASEFFGVAAVAAGPNNGGSSAEDNDTWDWGYTLVPTDSLTPQLVVGWGPGADDANNNGTPDGNGSPVYVTATADTIVYVDYDGNASTGPLTDIAGNQYDLALNLRRLEQRKIFDPSGDLSQTGMKLYTLDGALLTGAWGEDPSTAAAGNPFLDLGTTIPPHPWPRVTKTSREISDADGVYEPNDIVEYTVTIENLGVVVLTEMVITDPLPAGLTYIPGSTRLNGQAYPDNSSGSVYPLDGLGIEMPPVARGEMGTVSFQARITGGTVGTIKNIAYISTGPENFQGINCIEVEPPTASPCILRFMDGSFSAIGTYQEGDSVYVELQDQDLNLDPFLANTFTITVENSSNGDRETIVLTETGPNTGVFRSGPLSSSPTGGQSTQDGTLWMQSGQSIEVDYQDPFFPHETCTVPVSVFVPSEIKQLYLTGGGPPYNAGLDRVDPVAAGDVVTRTSGVLSSTGSSGGGITLDFTGSATNPGGVGGVTVSTFPTGTGDNRLMLVGVAIDQDAAAEVSSISYGAQSLTRVVSQENPAGPERVEIWQLVSPNSGNGSVVVTMNGAQHNGIVVVASTFTGADPGDPLGSPASASGPAVTVASDAGELVFGMVASGSPSALVGATGQIQLQQTGDGADIRGAGVTRLGAGSVTLSWSGGATEATAGVSIKPVQDGDSTGLAIWHGSGTTQPEFARFDGLSFGSPTSMPAVTDDRAGTLMAVASPTNPDEALFLEVTDDHEISVLLWDGSTGTFTTSLSNIARTDHEDYFGAVIAYEQSGDALLVYGKAGDASGIYYRQWNGSTWTSEARNSYNFAEEPRNFKIASSPSSDEIVVIAVIQDDKDHFGFVWNGSSWVSERALDPNDDNSGDGYYDIDVAYETLSGRAMFAYARNHSPGRIFYRFWNGSSWSGEGTLTYPSSGSNGKVDSINLASDLKSNRIGIAVTTSGNDSWAAVWNGSSWGNKQTLEVSDTDKSNASPSDVAFESATGQMVAVSWDKDRSNVHYRLWNASSGWSSEFDGPDVGNRARTLQLFADPLPGSRQIMLMINDEGADVSATLWNGTSWSSPNQLETNTGLNGDNTGLPMTFLWDTGAVASVGSLASSAFFPQIPPMAADLEMPSGGGVSVSAFIELTNGGTPGTASSRISSGTDDAEEEGPDTVWFYPGAMYIASTDLELVRDDDSPSSGAQKVGLRFNGLTIPAGARITNAYVAFTADSPEWPNTNSGAASVTIRGQAADNPGTFTYSDFNVSSRSTTSASVDWSNIPAWTTGQVYNSPDLSDVVQEIVDRPGWSSGNSMAFIINGSGSRTAESYNGSSSDAPELVVEYVVGGGVPSNPVVDATLFEDSTELITMQNPTVTDLGSGIYRMDWSGLVPSDVTIEAGNSVNLSIDNQQSGLEFQVLFDSVSRPSVVELPTTTVIEVDRVEVYDGPFPSGNLVTSGFTGETLYVRAVVSDPFGAYDITAADLVIDQLGGTDGDLVHSFINDEVVDATDASKTYEFQWYTADAEGSYDLEVTAKEGLENTIQDTGATQFVLSKEDTGSPGEIIFTDTLGARRAEFDVSEDVCLRTTDFDQKGAGGVLIGVTATGGLSEMRLLTESPADSGVFTYCYSAGTFVGSEQVTAIYVDPTDPADSASAVAVISDPVVPPTVLLSHTQVEPSDGIATVGSEVVFEIQVSNPGATTLDEVTVTDLFPTANLQFLSASVTPDSSVPGTLTWTGLGPLDQGQSREITVRFQALVETVSAECSTSCSGSVAAGPITADVEITRPEVTITKTLLTPVSGEMDYGQPGVFRIVVQNTGSTVLTTVPLTDEYSSALEFDSATVAPDGSGGGIAFWTDLTGVGTLALGDSITIETTFTAARREETAPNLAIVSGAVDENGDSVPRAESEAIVRTHAAAIGDYVWRDQDGDGVQDPHEQGIEGVRIFVDENLNGTADLDEPSEVTDADGFYLISNLDAGTYTVRVDATTLPAGVTQSFDADGTLDDSTQTTALTVNDTFDTADFGYTGGTSTIAGQVRADTNADGELSDPDTGIEGVRIELWTDPDGDGQSSDGTLMTSGITDLNGEFLFSALAPGPYTVVEVQASGVTSTNDKDGDARNTFDEVAMILGEAEDSENNDFLDADINDFGDMTSFAVAGSAATSALRLGDEVDAEPASVTDATASGDDLDGVPDDEDGLTLPTEAGQGQSTSMTARVTNGLNGAAFLNAWVDFNGNGVIGDSGEQIASNLSVAAGSVDVDRVINFSVPVSAALGDVGVRVRLTSTSGPGVAGLDGVGEVEDHLLTIVAATDDFGDLSSLPSAGSRANAALKMGLLVDVEDSARVNATGTGDDVSGSDDEDGVTLPATLARSVSETLTVNVTNTHGANAFLNVWVDFNGNNSLDDVGEQVASDLLISNGVSNQDQDIVFTVPGDAVLGQAAVRARLSNVASPGSSGFVGEGEVEDYLVTIACPVMAITPNTMPTLKEGTPMSQAFTTSAGSAPMTWGLASGNVPPGLSLSSSGTLSGTPTAGVVSNFNLRVTDNFGCVGTQLFSVRVCPIIAFAPAALPASAIGVPYSETIIASRGVAPYVFAVASGSLPAGLALDSATGVISGTPTTAGSQTFTVSATDANGCSDIKEYTLNPSCPAVAVTTSSLPDAILGESYSQSLAATNGNGGYTWSLVSGALPPGLVLSGGGLISGVPNASSSATYAFVIRVTDGFGCVATAPMTLRTCSGELVVAPLTLPNPNVGSAYSVGLSAGEQGFLIEQAGASVSVTNLAITEAVLNGANQAWRVTTTSSTVNYRAGGSVEGRFGDGRNFPIAGANDFAIRATAEILIPTAGVWSFGTNSDDGLRLRIDGGDVIVDDQLHSVEDRFGSVTLTAGLHSLELIYFEHGGTEAVELFAAAGSHGSFNSNFELIGSASGLEVRRPGGVYTWSLALGSLPAGLSLDPGSGAISGVASATVPETFTVQAVDSEGCTGTRAYTLTPQCPIIGISPTSLPNVEVGSSFASVSLLASGGESPYAWDVASGSLPLGMGLSSAGEVSGTPTAAGLVSFTARATDADGCEGTEAISVRVCPVISFENLDPVVVGEAYADSVAASGGASPYLYAVSSGTLPSGLNLDTASGAVSGTVTAESTANFTIQATDANGCIKTRDYSLDVVCPAIALTPPSLSVPTVGAAFSDSVTASGGSGPYTFAVTSGALPAGLSLAAGGQVTGTATSDAPASFEVTATDVNGCEGSRSYVVTPVCPAISLSAPPLAFANQGAPFSATLSAAGGTGPYQFVVTTGNLPAGLSLATNGSLSGTPTGDGLASFTVTATDSFGCQGSQSYDLRVCPALTFGSLSDGVVGTPYSDSVAVVSGGTGPFVYSLISGSLPAGLALDGGTGAISGTPTVEESQSFRVRSVDPNGCEATQDYTLAFVCPAISVGPGSLASGDINQSFSTTVTASGGTAPYAFSVSSGALPTGVTLDSGTGSLRGTPTVDGVFSFTIEAVDTHGCSGTVDHTWRICPAIQVAPALLSDAVVGTPYSITFSGLNGTGPYVWQLTGSVPAGLTWDAPSATLSGTPTTEDAGASMTLTATDANGCVGSSVVTLGVNCPVIDITPAVMPFGYPTVAYNQSLTATSGTAPYAWTMESGSLPDGLSLSAAGVISGVPTQFEAQTFTVRAVDAFGCAAEESVTLTIKGLTIGNLVWEDYDNDGQRDGGESGVPGAQVELYTPGDDNLVGGSGANADTLVAGPLTTASNGAYAFTDLFPGDYFVKVTPPADFVETSGVPDAVDNDEDNDNNGAQPGGSGSPVFSPVVALQPNSESIIDGDADADTNLTLDFGLWAPMSVGNVVFLDVNGDGDLDSTEGIEGVVVEIYPEGVDPLVSPATGAAYTDNKGRYLITALNPGRYFLHVPPSQFVSGPLTGVVPMAPSPVTDDNAGQDLLFTSTPATAGASTAPFDLFVGQAPAAGSETGFESETDDLTDARVDLTRDLGFVSPSGSGFPLSMRDQNDLSSGATDVGAGLSAVTFAAWSEGDSIDAMDDSDGDGLSNLYEYAMGTDPMSGTSGMETFALSVRDGEVDVVLRRANGGREDVRLVIEGRSTNGATQWVELEGWTSPTFDSTGRQIVRLEGVSTQLSRSGGRGLVRLKVELDADRNGDPEAVTYGFTLGWSRETFSPGTRTFAMPLEREAVFVGPFGSLNRSLESANAVRERLLAGEPFYVEILSGALAGHRIEVSELESNSAGLELDMTDERTTVASLNELGDADRVALRPHWTFNALFSPSTMDGGMGSASSDRIMAFDGKANAFCTHWVLTKPDGSSLWVADGDASLADVGGSALAAGEAIMIKVQASSQRLFVGQVREGTFHHRFDRGSQLIGRGTLGAKGLNEFLPGNSMETQINEMDQLRVWSGDHEPGQSGYWTYDRVAQGWMQTDAETTAVPVWDAFHGVFYVSPRGDSDWTEVVP